MPASPQSIQVRLSTTELRELLAKGTPEIIKRVVRRAGMTGLRDMVGAGKKSVRSHLRIKAAIARKQLEQAVKRGRAVDDLEWALNVRDDMVPLSAFPYVEKTVMKMSKPAEDGTSFPYFRTAGVTTQTWKGRRKFIRDAFSGIGRGKSGNQGKHLGIWVRREKKGRLPLRELLGPRPIDVLRNDGEAEKVAEVGGRAFSSAIMRLLAMELAAEAAKAALADAQAGGA